MLARQAQQVMPASGSAQLDQGQARQATVGQERTVGLAQGGDDAIKQDADDGPWPFFPGLLERHDLPTHR